MKKGKQSEPAETSNQTQFAQSPPIDLFYSSCDVANEMVAHIIDSYEKEIQLRALMQIRLPYATKHTLTSALVGINDIMV